MRLVSFLLFFGGNSITGLPSQPYTALYWLSEQTGRLTAPCFLGTPSGRVNWVGLRDFGFSRWVGEIEGVIE